MSYRKKTLEEKADNLLMEDRRDTLGVSDWLSAEQLKIREREIPAGLIQGRNPRMMYRRAYNPNIGKRPDPQKLFRMGMDPWDQALYEYYR